METAEYVSALEREGALLAAAAGRRGLRAPVPACPGWQVRDLLRHLGYVHRWAATYVGQARQEMTDEPAETEILQSGPADPELLGWFRDGLADLAAALRSADPALTCWTFIAAPTPLVFWARRQAHETAIHRADAEGVASNAPGQHAAVSPVTPVPAAFAADGIDELLTGFAPRAKFRLEAAGSDDPRHSREDSLEVRATDTSDVWYAVIGPRVTARRGAPSAQAAHARCVLAGRAADLYLLLWNRRPAGPVTVSGDVTALELWRSRIQVTW